MPTFRRFQYVPVVSWSGLLLGCPPPAAPTVEPSSPSDLCANIQIKALAPNLTASPNTYSLSSDHSPCQLIPAFNLDQYVALGGSADTVADIVPEASAVMLKVVPPGVVLTVIFPAATVFT